MLDASNARLNFTVNQSVGSSSMCVSQPRRQVPRIKAIVTLNPLMFPMQNTEASKAGL